MSALIAGAVIGGIIAGGSSLHGKSKYNRQLTEAFKKQMYYAQMNYNYNQAQLDRQEKSAYDQAVSNLFNLSLNALQNNASVYAAQAQSGFQGRTSGKLRQTINGQFLRQQTAVKDAHEVKVSEIRGAKDKLYIEMRNSADQQRDALKSKYKGGMSYVFEFGQQVAQGAAMGAVGGAAVGALTGTAGGAAGGAASGSGSFLTNFNSILQSNQGLFQALGQAGSFMGSMSKNQGGLN